jgi:hypothetical protein
LTGEAVRPPDLQKQFIRTFDSIGRHRSRYERFADFLELATCAIRKTTVPPGPEADAFEQRYMNVVARYPPDDIRTMPKLLAFTQLAVAHGGCDFLGGIAGELEFLDPSLGQLITPYPLSRLIAEMTLQDAAGLIADRGFVTLQEPASGAGGMIIAAADVLETKGFDPRSTLYVEALDVAGLCFKMTYLQLALRGVPATVRHANTLSLETYESAHTPAFLLFLQQHGAAFQRWQEEARMVPAASATPVQGDLFEDRQPKKPSQRPPRHRSHKPDL